MDLAYLRIGELARRSGVSSDVLRKWETRYGVPAPTRTKSGYRLYTDADLERVLSMREQLDAGMSAAQAARVVESQSEPAGGGALADRLEAALAAFDDAAAHRELDRLVASLSVEAVVTEAVLPCLRRFGERWQEAPVAIGREHFATGLLRGRLLGLGRGWGAGGGSHALLAAPAGEQHDLGLICFGLLLRGAGWRITYLGPDTPGAALQGVTGELRPHAVVVAAVMRRPLTRAIDDLTAIARQARLFLAGAGAEQALADGCDALALPPDLRDAVAMMRASTSAAD